MLFKKNIHLLFFIRERCEKFGYIRGVTGKESRKKAKEKTAEHAGEREWTGVYRAIAGGSYLGAVLSPRCAVPKIKGKRTSAQFPPSRKRRNVAEPLSLPPTAGSYSPLSSSVLFYTRKRINRIQYRITFYESYLGFVTLRIIRRRLIS